MPDRDYYTKDDDASKKLRDAYVAHVTKMLTLLGESAEKADADSKKILALETSLAQASRTRVELRDPEKNYNKMTPDQLQQLTPDWKWAEYFKEIGLTTPGDVDVHQPDFFKTMNTAFASTSLEKLAAFQVKIGYPEKFRDYSTLMVDRGPFVLNELRAENFEAKRELNKIGKPVDRAEWGMTPPTVNAYYNPKMNEIVFPAGILQPPFFFANADDAVNYGGIGAVIGHEMTHGFDDQGRQYDKVGIWTDWWSPQSAEEFTKRAQAIINQYNEYEPLPGLHVNGQLTQGENIADVGGVKLAYAALQKALEKHPENRDKKIDGFTPEQRFFLSFAGIWRQKIRDEEQKLRLNTDPHSPGHYRVNGPLSDLPEFQKAFNVPETAPMVRAADKRANIW